MAALPRQSFLYKVLPHRHYFNDNILKCKFFDTFFINVNKLSFLSINIHFFNIEQFISSNLTFTFFIIISWNLCPFYVY